MSLTASLLQGKTVESTLDSLFKNSAGPSATPAPIPAKIRKPYPEDLTDQPKKKIKTPKPKSTPVSRKDKKNKQKGADDDMNSDHEDENEEEEDEEDSSNKKKSKASIEDKYEAKLIATSAKKPKTKRESQMGDNTPKETKELVQQQTKHDYGKDVDMEESKIEDLVHESLRKNNKRKADTSLSESLDAKDSKISKKAKSTDAVELEDVDLDNKAASPNTTKDDPERQARTVFVGNLAVACMAQAQFRKLKSTFAQYGPVESIRFRSIAFSELLPRKVAFITGKLHPERDVVNAYIVFKNKESVAKAVAALNGQLFLNKHIRVDTVDGAKKHQPKKSVFVGNLAFDAQEEDLWNFFKDCGDIENVRIIRDNKTNLGKGFAYVQFQDRASVDVALRLHDTKMGSRKLRVVRCKRLEEENKKTNGMGPRSMAGVVKGAKSSIKDKDDKPAKTQHAPIVMDGVAKRLAFKARKANEKHILTKKKAGIIVEGERSQKGAKVDLGIKKGKTKVKSNVPKKKIVKK